MENGLSPQRLSLTASGSLETGERVPEWFLMFPSVVVCCHSLARSAAVKSRSCDSRQQWLADTSGP